MTDYKHKSRNHSKGNYHNQLATAAALDAKAFGSQAVNEAIPADWNERASKAWEYYTEEPIVSNAINTWRIFAVGDEIKITAEDEAIEEEAIELFYRLDLNEFIKDMVLQLLVKGDCVGYFNRDQDGLDIEKVTCVNPISVKFKFDNGEMASAKQMKETTPGGIRFGG